MAQEAVVRALGDRAFYPHHPETVTHVQTHISHVFLAGPYVYKLKKAVRFPFLDFSTATLRRHFCTEEVRLNRRLSPEVYRDVVPITRADDGALRLGGTGAAVEHVVWMYRLPTERMLTSLLAAGDVSAAMMDVLARKIATFHAAAPSGPEIAAHAHPDALRARWEEESRSTAPFAGSLLAAEDHDILADFGAHFIHTHQTLLRARQDAGRIRDGHGDLHAEHVCFVDAPVPAGLDTVPLAPGIYIFDCIEFSEAFRCNDVASEVAFLAMDLESLGHPDLARRFVSAYVDAAGDPLVHVLLPFYACYRAGVRGKVEGLKSLESEVEPADRDAAADRARHHFALAVRYAWDAGGPVLIACSGLPGTGKTTLAREVAAATGALMLSSDAIRKRARAAETPSVAGFGEGLYSVAARADVYETLSAEAEAALAAGRSVVADATFVHRADRRRLAEVAARRGHPFALVDCRADEAVVRARLEARTHTESLSDARWDTYVALRARREPAGGDEPVIVVDTSGPIATARAAALRQLWDWRRSR